MTTGNAAARPLSEGFDRHDIAIAGMPAVLDRSGALYLPGERTLVVADLHLEKGSAAAERGSFLPPYDTRTTLGRLVAVAQTYDPDRIVLLGDSLHDERAAVRLNDDDLEVVQALRQGRDWVWVRGNHDPVIPPSLGGRVVDELRFGRLALRHIPAAGPATAEIAGHMHPSARLRRHGLTVRRPCFVANGHRLVMPAFGAFTGGLDIFAPAFAPILGAEALKVWMIGFEGLYPVAARDLATG